MSRNTEVSMIVRQVVDRCHVGDSNMEVLRYFRSRLSREARRDPSKRAQRKDLLRQALARHAQNRELYGYVMRGLR